MVPHLLYSVSNVAKSVSAQDAIPLLLFIVILLIHASKEENCFATTATTGLEPIQCALTVQGNR